MSDGWIEIAEHTDVLVSRHELADEDGDFLWAAYGREAGGISVDFPSPKTGHAWRLGAGGSVGSFPLPKAGGVRVRPKVPIANLFRMLDVAYDLDLRALDGEAPVASLDDLYDRLAARLAGQVLDRVRRGLVKEYLGTRDELPYVRGRIDVARHARRPVATRIDCTYLEHTTDQHDNRVLAWTLHRLARSPLLRSSTRRHVRRAVGAISPPVARVPIDPTRAVRDAYDRLRSDYRPMHLLSRFFLMHAGPDHRAGSYAMTPFVVPMPELFERFVALSLRAALPERLRLDAQESMSLDVYGAVRFRIDLVVRDRASARPLLALDTKYKAHGAPASDDVQQATAYAAALRCTRAALIYPLPSDYGRAVAGDIEVHRLALPLGGDVGADVGLLVARVTELADEVAQQAPAASLFRSITT